MEYEISKFESLYALRGRRPSALLAEFGLLAIVDGKITARNIPDLVFGIMQDGELITGYGHSTYDISDVRPAPTYDRETQLISWDGPDRVFLQKRPRQPYLSAGIRRMDQTPLAAVKALGVGLQAVLQTRQGGGNTRSSRVTLEELFRAIGLDPSRNSPITEAEEASILGYMETIFEGQVMSWDALPPDSGRPPLPRAMVREPRLKLSPGLWVVVGATATGKSSLLHGHGGTPGIIKTLNAETIKFGEPEPFQSAYSVPALARAIAAAFEKSDVVVVDSLKQLLLTSDSNLGKGGLSGALNAQLSDWSSTLSSLERTLVVTINPLGLGADDLARFVDSVEGVAEVVFHTIGVGGGGMLVGETGSRLSISSRSGGARGQQRVTVTIPKEGLLMSTIGDDVL